MSKTIVSIIVIVIIVFAFITIKKLEDFPTGDCCKNIKVPTSTVCHSCDYNLPEKIIYVWRFS